jgi:D-alanyl-D-alanine carboxypeptidase
MQVRKLTAQSALALLALGCSPLGCGGDGAHAQAGLNSLLATRWAGYASARANWKGGVAVYVITPRATYFSSTSLGGAADEHLHFRGASTTKPFTAAAIMLLHQQGRLNIDDTLVAPIPGSSEPYVPDTPAYDIPYKAQITIRSLLSHRSGVFDVANDVIPTTVDAPYAGQIYLFWVENDEPDHTFSFDELVGVVATHGLSYFAPDTASHYSDTGFSLLGEIIERVSGQRYDQFVQENLAAPNGLRDSSFPRLGNDRALPAPFATGYSWTQGVSNDVTEDNVSAHVAEGNIITTPFDLATWMSRLLAGEAGLAAATIQMMTDISPSGFGLGIRHEPGLGFGHDGGHDGYATVAFSDPSQGVTIVLSASNIDADDLAGYFDFLHDTCRAVKELLGYSTADAADASTPHPG